MRKQFAEFDAMHKEISASPLISTGMRSPFPKKTYFFQSLGPAEVEQRMHDLNAFLQEVVGKMNSSQDRLLKSKVGEFLEVDRHVTLQTKKQELLRQNQKLLRRRLESAEATDGDMHAWLATIDGATAREIDLKWCTGAVSYTHLTLPTTPYV